MSTPINDGGPAFPSDYIPGTATTPGMSLRDWFAGNALNGILMNYTTERFGISEKSIADHAYKLADALLVSREGKGGAA
jgi:hypothetical protein